MTDINKFDNTFKLSRISLLVSGVKISDTKWSPVIDYFINRILFIFNFVWLYTDVMGECYLLTDAILNGTNFQDLSIIVPCINIACLATTKSASLYMNRGIVIDIINKLRAIHPILKGNEEETEDNYERYEKTRNSIRIQRRIVKESIKLLNVVVSLLYYMSSLVIFAFCFTSPITMCYGYYKYDKMDMKLPFPVKYFFDPLVGWRWPFVYFHQVWSSLVCCFNLLGTDTLFYGFCVYIQMHFRILSHRFEYLVLLSSRDNLKENCLSLVKKHKDLTQLVKSVEILYSTSTLINIFISSVLICLCGFNIVFLEDSSTIFAFTTFLFMNLSQIYMLCFFGDMLMRSSSEVSNAIYSCNWYNVDERMKKTLLIVLIRCQKPCKLTAANFVDLNLRAFTTILSRSWSYFALLNSVYRKI